MELRPVRFLAFVAAISVSGWAAGDAVPSNWDTPYDELFSQPGAEVSSYLNEDGLEVRKLIIPGETVIIQTHKGERISTLVSDISGRGAVLCMWMILVETRAALDVYGDLKSPLAVERLDMAISWINEFVTENSVEHTSTEQLEIAYQARLDSIRRRGLDAKSVEFFEEMIERLESQPEERFKRDLEDLLSVPRLPAMDPCL